MKRALVTGSHGFAGTHLRRLLGAQGWAVAGLGRAPRDPGPGEGYVAADLRDVEALGRAVTEAAPDVVFHLAGHLGRGGAASHREAVDVNAAGTRALFEALAIRGRPVRVVVAGSSAQYGAAPADENPIDEDTPFRAAGAYGFSKVAAEGIALAYHGRDGIDVVAVRPFNHVGPGEPDLWVCSSFARAVAEIEAGAEPVMSVGNLEAVRDFCDVRDVARGYLALAERGRGGRAYNLCSGRGTRIRDVLERLVALSSRPIEVRPDPERMRPADVPLQVGSHERATRETGWAPEIPLEQSLKDLLAGWTPRVARAASR